MSGDGALLDRDGTLNASRLVGSLNRHLAAHTGGEVEVRRCVRETGELLPMDESDRGRALSDADFAMRQGQLARLLSLLSPREKVEWAAARRAEGNEHYHAGRTEEAVQHYLDCLLAMDLGEDSAESRRLARDAIQLPVLCNLAACYLGKGQLLRAKRLCDEALALDEGCLKARLRRAKALTLLGEFKLARADLNAAERLQPGAAHEELALLARSARAAHEHHEAQKSTWKRAMAAGFGSSQAAEVTPRGVPGADDAPDTAKPGLDKRARPAHKPEAESAAGAGAEVETEAEAPLLTSAIAFCTALRRVVKRFLEFRTDPPIKFD
jgi:tetratricopeptide (TPR) repeat protein